MALQNTSRCPACGATLNIESTDCGKGYVSVEELKLVVEALKKAVQQNGGPISPDDTVDGIGYVMIREVDFVSLQSALARAEKLEGK